MPCNERETSFWLLPRFSQSTTRIISQYIQLNFHLTSQGVLFLQILDASPHPLPRYRSTVWPSLCWVMCPTSDSPPTHHCLPGSAGNESSQIKSALDLTRLGRSDQRFDLYLADLIWLYSNTDSIQIQISPNPRYIPYKIEILGKILKRFSLLTCFVYAKSKKNK